MNFRPQLAVALGILFCGCSLFYGSRTLDSIAIDGKISIVSEVEARIQAHPAASPAPTAGAVPRGAVPDVPLSSFSTVKVHDGEINALITSRDGRSAFSGGLDGKVVVTSIGDLAPSGSYATFSEELSVGAKPVVALALSPDERLLAIAQPSLVVVVDLRRRLFLYKMSRIEGRITALAWDPQGQILAIGRANGDIYIWNVLEGPSAGEDTNDALEVYSAAASPVVGIVFHPSGRMFFAAESSGILSIWRLLRTEEEMGLRDSWAIVDQRRTTTKRRAFARVRSRVQDVWLNPEGTVFYAAASDGSIFRWKVRGLSLRQPLKAGSDPVFSISGLSVGSGGAARRSLVASGDRSQRIRFWCAENDFETPAEPVAGVEVLNPVLAPVTTTDDDTPAAAAAAELGMNDMQELADEEASKLAALQAQQEEAAAAVIVGQRPAADEAAKRRVGFIGQSETLAVPASIIRCGESRPFLWATQKTGNLLVFDALLLMKSDDWLPQILNCKGLSR